MWLPFIVIRLLGCSKWLLWCGYTFTMLILQSDVPPESKEPNLISVRCSDAEIWLIYVIVWLLGYCKWLLGCGYRVY